MILHRFSFLASFDHSWKYAKMGKFLRRIKLQNTLTTCGKIERRGAAFTNNRSSHPPVRKITIRDDK
jgi:hypothetical protein